MITRAGPLGGFALAVLAVLTLAGAAFAQPKFPALSGRVVDEANLISPAAEQQLTADLASLEQTSGRQLVVATVPSLQGLEIEDYGYQLGRAWGIGDKDRDDGAILLVAPNDRKVRIEVGYGLEPILTDALSSLIIQQRILPAFREGRMEEGVLDGAKAVIDQLALPSEEAQARAAQATPAKVRSSGGSGVPAIVIFFILFWVLSAVLRGGGRRGRRGRGGGSAWWLLPMILSSSSRGGGWGGGGGGGGGWGGGGGGSFGGGGASGGW